MLRKALMSHMGVCLGPLTQQGADFPVHVLMISAIGTYCWCSSARARCDCRRSILTKVSRLNQSPVSGSTKSGVVSLRRGWSSLLMHSSDISRAAMASAIMRPPSPSRTTWGRCENFLLCLSFLDGQRSITAKPPSSNSVAILTLDGLTFTPSSVYQFAAARLKRSGGGASVCPRG